MADLQKALYKARPKLYPARQRLTLPKREGEKRAVALAPAKRLADYDLADGAELTFKDLGPQVPLNFQFWYFVCLFSIGGQCAATSVLHARQQVGHVALRGCQHHPLALLQRLHAPGAATAWKCNRPGPGAGCAVCSPCTAPAGAD